MKKRIYSLIILFAMVTMVFLPLSVLGATSVTIDIKTRDDLTKEDLENRTLGIWKLDENLIDTSIDRTKLSSILDKLSDEELDKLIASPSDKWIIYPKEKDDYKVTLNLEPGIYYVREIGGKDRKRYPEPAIFNPSETDIVKLKWGERITPPPPPDIPPPPPDIPPPPPDIPPPPDTILLIKTDDEGNYLSGAKFTLCYENGEAVMTKNGTFDEKGSAEVFVTDKDGRITIRDAKPGLYFFKEIEAPHGYEIVNEQSDFAIFKGEGATVKVINKKRLGSFNFFKTDDSRKIGLSGAEFVITRNVNGIDQKIKRNGKDLVLNSADDGKFSVYDLPYGTYNIWETKAPSDYTLLQGSLKFEIDDNSFEKVLIIENSKKPPIPKTGDITLIVLVIAGAVMIGLGKYLIKDKN